MKLWKQKEENTIIILFIITWIKKLNNLTIKNNDTIINIIITIIFLINNGNFYIN